MLPLETLYDRFQDALNRWMFLRDNLPDDLNPKTLEFSDYRDCFKERQLAWRDYVSARDEYHRAAWKKLKEEREQAQLP